MKHFIQQLITCLVLGMLSLSTAWATEDKTFDASNLWYYDLTVGQTYNITYTNRTFQAGAIETICLPFAISKEQIIATFGEGTTVWEYTAQNEKNAVFSKVNIDNGLAAATPYLIKTSKTVTELHFQNVEFGLNEKSYSNSNTQTLKHFEGSNYYFYGCAYRHEWYQACLTMSGTNSYAINSSGKIVSDVSNAYSDSKTPALSANFIYTSSSGTPTIKLEGYDQNSESGSGETEPDNEEESDDPNLPAMGFTDLGKGGIFNHGENAYCFRGNSTNIVGGAIVTITSDGTNIVCYSSKSDYTGWSRAKQFTLTVDQAANIASNNYIFYVGAWDGATVTDITVELPGGGEGGGGGSTGMTLTQKIEAKAQLTDVPTLYITVPDAIDKAINDVLDIKKEYHTATIQLVDKTEGGLTEFTDQVMIKVRGNSTAKENKKPYRLKFAKEIKDAEGNVVATCQKHDMLGQGYSKRNWALLANYLDPAMVRNALTNKIGELVGMPFRPGYKFADVVINGEYRGTYQITDHVEADADRVNVNEDTGWFLESARGDMVEAPSASAQSLMMSIKNPDTDKWTSEQIATLKTEIQDWFKPVDDLFCINNGSFELSAFTDPISGWRKYWDEESLVNFYIGINLTGDYDGFMTVKMYRDLNKKLKFGPLWDKDLAFGNYSADKGTTLAEDQQTGSYFTSYVKRLWEDPLFVKKVHDKLNTLISNGIITTLKNNVDELVELTAQTEQLNRTLWGIGASWTQSFSTREAAIKQLKDYLDQHISWFQNTINDRYTTLGGDNIVDNSIPGDDFNDGAGGDEPTSTFDYSTATGGHKIPASAFCSNATKVEVTFTVSNDEEFWGYYGYNGSQWSANSFTSVRKTKTIVIEDAASIALIVKNGITFELQTNGTMGSLTVNVVNTIPEVPDVQTRQQLTNLPTIYLDAATVDDAWKGVALEVFDKDNVFGQGVTWTKTTADVSAQYQGSGDKNKDSYRLKFESKIKLMGANKYKQWVLLANDDDPSMINNALAKELGNAVGMPWTPGYQFVDLYVNNEYMGTYQVTDRVKAEDGRSLVSGGNNKTDWQVRFNDDAELAEDGTQDYIKATNGVNVIYKNPDPKDLTAEQVTALRTDMKAYFDEVFTKTNGTYPNFVANVDKEQLINWYICQEILGVYKGFSSIEAYRSVTETAADNLLHFGPLWDSEKGFGNLGGAPAMSMADKETPNSYDGLMTNYAAYGEMKDLFNYLWTEDWFKSGVISKWNTLYTGSTESGLAQTLKTKATQISGTLSESQPKNLEKWENSLEYNSTTHAKHADYATAVAAISTYIDARFPYLDAKFNELAGDVEICEHTYTSNVYTDNGDGTHSPKCDKCDYVNTEVKTNHSYIAKEGHPYCDICKATETASVEGTVTENTKVYRIHEAVKTTDIKYITAESTFTPNSNKIYICNEEITGETNLKNVVWPRSADADYNGNEIVFVDGDYTYDEKASMHVKSASYTRSMSSTWGTLCLPFKIASCDDYTLYEIKDTKIGDDRTGTLIFSEIESASGLQPVLFRKNTSAGSVTFRGVAQTKDGPDNGLVTVKKSKKYIADENESDAKFIATVENSGKWVLYGNVKKSNTAKIAETPNIYYIAQNKFWQATADVKIDAFRAVFIFTPTPGNEAAAKTFSIAINDDTVTAINDNSIDKNLAIFTGNGRVILNSNYDTKVSIYNINGTSIVNTNLEKGTEKSFALPKGIYIINGTKVAVK